MKVRNKLSTKSLPGVTGALWGLLLVTLTTLAVLALWLVEPLAVQNLRLAQFDQFQRWHPRPYTPVAVRVVDIDEASLKSLGQWPWPRTRIAELVDRLHEAGALAIAFDVLLTEPDRTAPAAMAQQWNNPQVSALLSGLPDPDTTLAQRLMDRPVVLGSSLLRNTPAHPLALHAALPFRVVRSGPAGAGSIVQGFDAVLWPLPGLLAQAQGVGALNAAPDGDGVVRRAPLFLRVGTELVPSLSAEALRVAQGARNYVVRSEATGIQDVRIGNYTVPTNTQGEVWLHYTQEQPQRLVPAHAVIHRQVAPEQLQGHIVLVGSSAAGLMDVRANPMGYSMPGVLAHAQALEQMLLGQYLQRPPWAAALELVVLALGCLGLGAVALTASARRGALSLLALLALLGAGGWYAFVARGWLLDVSNPALAMVLVFGFASGFHHWSTERQQRWLRTAFSRYVSPNRVAHLVANPDQLHLGGKRQVCSFVFTDLQGFTSMLEASDPAQVVSLLNDYMEAMLVIVFKHEGTLDRFVGDAVAVLFSAPVPQEDHRQRALDCALEMDAFATAYARRQQAAGVNWGQTRIGVHCGEVLVGNFGGKTLFDYRALGDPINTAARLESVNKHLGTRVCVSQAVLDGCQGVAVREVGRLLLKGKSQPLQVFAPVATLDVQTCAPSVDYDAAMVKLRPGPAQDLHGARAVFEQLALKHPNDPLVALHVQRLCLDAADDLIVMADK
jgi:adenylate cyclase